MVSQVLGPYRDTDSIFDTTTVMEHWGLCSSTQEELMPWGAGAEALRHASPVPVWWQIA